MNGNSDIAFLIFLLALIFAFVGEPDLHSVLVDRISASCEAGK